MAPALLWSSHKRDMENDSRGGARVVLRVESRSQKNWLLTAPLARVLVNAVQRCYVKISTVTAGCASTTAATWRMRAWSRAAPP
jgi:hypothetical protein